MSAPPRVLGVIPARFASSRFPGKALVTLQNKPILQHVWEKSRKAASLSEVLIATDDDRIFAAAQAFGASVVMTSTDHLSGTDRVSEAALAKDCEIVVNIQGDEPLIDPAAIDLAAQALIDDPSLVMSTLKKRISEPSEIMNPNVVKVVTAGSGDAIYFSRCPIPYNRGVNEAYFKHIGLYVYRKDFLLNYSSMPVGPLERAESLEQLRALENGHRIRVLETEYESLGVDTPQDLERVIELLESSALKKGIPTHHG
ncbi:3-deoxy-manno-octulosonate cytidylyltransferase [Bryobacter aggregatus]|uniref:3-deoxy-manno-octulosonate cytidylyltransferase n=1 Tax=Bryobacter aggregatus TaxID=360054 RepID=UPI0004E0D9EC